MNTAPQHETADALAGHSGASSGWLDAEGLDWRAELEASFGDIRKELERVLGLKAWTPWGDDHVKPYTQSFTLTSEAELRKIAEQSRGRIGEDEKPNWRLFGLYLKGKSLPAGCAMCPRTAAAVKRIPRMVNAGFSCLEAGYRLKRHRGYDQTLYRTHLALIVPPGDCALSVSDEERRWEEGKTVMFDDTNDHEAWNLTGEHRFVLIVDTLNSRAD